MPWKEFEATIGELDRFRNDYSKESADILGHIKTFMLDGMDAYFRSTQSVYEWSSLAEKLLERYIRLFEQNDEAKSTAQKVILLKVFDEGIDKMKVAQKELDNSSAAFNKAAGNLTSLRHRLTNEFDSKSDYYAEKVSLLRLKGYGGAAVFGLTGLAIAWLTLEKNIIPELDEKLASIKKFYDEMEAKVSKAFVDIDTTKMRLKDEIRVIGELKTQTDETKTYVILDAELQSIATDSAKELIEKCRQYRERHISPEKQ